MTNRQNYRSGRPFEVAGGFSRAVRVDAPTGHVYVGGTTSTDVDSQVIHPGDPYRQTRQALAIVETALEALGASLEDVVRTRMYVVDIATNHDEVGRAHREIFEHIQPAETMVGIAELAHPDMLVEIDVEALV